MIPARSNQETETHILSQFEIKSLHDDKYWSFKGRSKRTQCHALIQYPAMMVPEMQGELIDIIRNNGEDVSSVYDPFVGSGTTLGEALTRGLSFGGTDINPLAILACEVKSGPFYLKSLKTKIDELLERITNDQSSEIDIHFFGRDKWFIPRVLVELCKIRRAIRLEKRKWVRKFFWVALSDTVRSTCNSRSSTYKLHVKEDNKIEAVGSPISFFTDKLLRNYGLKKEQKEILKLNNHLNRAHHSSDVVLSNEDVNSHSSKLKKKYDLLVTSPPYGDNGTTVPYGQFSYLSLKWIDTKDINSKVDEKLLLNTASIDSAGLGGSKRIAEHHFKFLKISSKTFNAVYKELEKQPNKDGLKRYTAFFRDLNASLPNILENLRTEAYMLWTLGNRHISGVEIPLNDILKELLEFQGCKFIHEIDREILDKKMPRRNNKSKTMTNETILIMKKGL